MAKGKRIYQHRGYLITPTENGKWFVHGFDEEIDTLIKCYNFIDSKVGGWPTKRKPKRLDKN